MTSAPSQVLLDIADGIRITQDFITARVSLVGMSGAGKSNAFTRMVEQVYRIGGLFVFIDPLGSSWGLRASADGEGIGLAIPIFGGYHADVDIRPDAGALVARELYHADASALIDLSAFADPRAGALFVADFGNELMRLHRIGKKPRAVFVDEAQTLAPERLSSGESDASTIMLWNMHTGGRNFGLGLKTATQSAAEQSKRTMKQSELFVALRTFSPLDQKPILDYLRTSVPKNEAAEISMTLATLNDGEAWFISPRWLTTLKRTRFRFRETFDSSRTPVLGEIVAQPRVLAPVDLARISAAIDEVGASEITMTTGDLRARVERLQRENAELRAGHHDQLLRDEVARLTLLVTQHRDDLVAVGQRAGRLEAFQSEALKLATAIIDLSNTHVAPLANVRIEQTIAPVREAPILYQEGNIVRVETRPAGEAPAGKSRAPGHRTERQASASPIIPSKGSVSEKILAALAAYRDEGLTSKRLCAIAEIRMSGTFHGAIAAFRRDGIIAQGQPLRITPLGIDLFGPFPTMPKGAALRKFWLEHVNPTEQLILKALYDVYPHTLSGPSIMTDAGRSLSGTYHAAIAKLRALKLVEGSGKALRATDVLFAK